MATALTVYLTETASTTVSTADTLLENASTGATLSNKNTNLTSGTTGWIEIWSQGDASAQTGAGSEPSPSGHGWCDDNTTLVGNSFVSGTWTFTLGFECTTTGTFTTDVHFRAYQRSSGGTYTLICEATQTSQTLVSTSYTVLNTSVSASSSNTFASGDKLYIDVLFNIATNSTTGNMRMQASSSSTVGSVSAQVVTPGYSSVTTNTRTITTSAVLLGTVTRTIPTSAVLLSTLTRTISSSAVLLATIKRTITTSAVLSGNFRGIPSSAALLSTNTRTILSSAVVINTFTRTIPSSAVLYNPATFYASNVGFSILADRPKAYYRLDELSGTTAYDSSGNGYNGTLTGTITYNQTGALASRDVCMFFSGLSAGVSLPYTLNPTLWSAATLEFWIKISAGWQYIAVTFDNVAGTQTIYLNGAVYSSGSGDFVGIDIDDYYAGSSSNGYLDEIAVYDHALTATQIANHYALGSLIAVEPSLPYACELSEVLGGTETSYSVTMPASGTNTYVELRSGGGTVSGTLALPNPTGNGWFISLSGQTIVSGPWWSTFTLAKSGSSLSGCSLLVRYYRRTIDGSYYSIGSTTLTGQTFSTTKTAYITPSTSATLWQFITGDVLYIDAFVLNANVAWSSDVFTVYVSNSATAGVSNDGVTYAPLLITTPAGISCLVGNAQIQAGIGLPIRDQSITIQDALDQRSIARLTEEDATASTIYSPNMPVMISDHDKGLMYTGYLANDQMSKIAAGNSSAQIEHMLTTVDHHRDFDKEANTINYLNWASGDIICDFIQQQQYKNGIWGEFALESDYTPTTLGQGTLSNTIATTTTSPFTYAPNSATPPVTSNTGDLELVRAGTQFTLTEQTTSDFSSGTLTNMTAINNTLTPTTQSAIKIVIELSPITTGANVAATESGGVQTNQELIGNLIDIGIWSGSQVIGTNDTFNYDIWIASTSPAFMAGINLDFSDLTQFWSTESSILDSVGNQAFFDSNGVSPDYITDLSGYAKDAWYTRSFSVPSSMIGKTVTVVKLYIFGSTPGTYTVYFKNCYLGSHSGSPFFGTAATSTNVNPPLIISGYGGYLLSSFISSIVQVYNPVQSYRVSPVHSISSVGLVQNSNINWTASLPITGSSAIVTYPPGTSSTLLASVSSGSAASANSTPAMITMISYDGNTWLQCQNSEALPGLPPGSNVSGLSFYLREQFACGPDPSAIPSLEQVQITINSAANQTVNDITVAYGTSTQWNTGTRVLTGPNSNGNLTLGSSANPLTQNWSASNIGAFQTFLAGANNDGTNNISSPVYSMTTGAEPSGGAWCQCRFDWAGYFLNGTIEADVKTSATLSQCGIEYRQTGWGNANNNGAYYVCIVANGSSGTVQFGYGANNNDNTSGTFTTVISVTETVNTNTYYHLKIVVLGNRHTIYFNHNSTPVIDILDNAYPGAGQIGFRNFTGGTSAITSSIENFSLVTTTVGTWTSPTTSLSSLTTCGYNQVCWTDLNVAGQVETTTLVLASIDGGSTWQQCTNGAQIPQLTRGTNVSSASLVLQMILFSSNPIITTPIIMGLYARICGNYGTVTGTRISPAIDLSPVGYVGSSNVMWNANTPTNTAVTVQTTQDLSTYHTVNNNGAGESLPYWTNQPSSTQDLFTTNTINNYTNTNGPGGSPATINYTENLSNMTLTGGSEALYYNNTVFSTTDVEVLCDMDESDTGGLIWGLADTNDYYGIIVYDASSSGGLTNTIQLYKYSGGSKTYLGSTLSITFTRGTFHRIRVKMKAGLINIYFDGVCIQSYLDTSPLSTGYAGFRNSGGASRYYQFYIQPLGTNLTGQALFTKVTLSTSDPQYMPQLFTLVACVRGPSIASGSVISQLHPITLPFAALYSTEMDTLIRISGDYYWYIDKWKQLRFAQRQARQGAFPLQSIQDSAGNYSGYYLYNPLLTSTVSADPLRNQQIIIDVTNLVSPPAQLFVSDGTTISWALGYPVYSAPTITINGAPSTVGVQGIDNGKQFYWQPNSASINYDSTLPKLPVGTIISVTYVGQSTVNTVINNSASQIAQAALEGGNSGIIVEIEDANTLNTTTAATFGMTSSQATAYANGLLSRFGFVSPVEIIGTTLYAGQSPAIGLVPGTVISAFIPELSQWNAQLPIVKVTTTAYQSANGVLYLYQIDATNGANLSQWQRVWF